MVSINCWNRREDFIFALGHYYIYGKMDPLEKRNFADGIGDATTGLLPFMVNQSSHT